MAGLFHLRLTAAAFWHRQGLQRVLSHATTGLEGSGRAALDEYSASAAATPGASTDTGAAPSQQSIVRAAAAAAGKLQRQLEALAEGLAGVGQAQLLRQHISLELRLLST